jgi:hypothetical protein
MQFSALKTSNSKGNLVILAESNGMASVVVLGSTEQDLRRTHEHPPRDTARCVPMSRNDHTGFESATEIARI